MGLTNKQKIFVKEYLVDKNASRAARAAGYTGSDVNIRKIGSELLTKPDVAEAIQDGLEAQEADAAARAKKRGVTKDRWLRELEIIAFADMDDFVLVEEEKRKRWEGSDEKGQMISEMITRFRMLPSAARKKGRSRVIKKLHNTITQHGGSEGIELHAKIPALEVIGRACGWLKDDAVVQPNNVNLVITLPSNGRELKKK